MPLIVFVTVNPDMFTVPVNTALVAVIKLPTVNTLVTVKLFAVALVNPMDPIVDNPVTVKLVTVTLVAVVLPKVVCPLTSNVVDCTSLDVKVFDIVKLVNVPITAKTSVAVILFA